MIIGSKKYYDSSLYPHIVHNFASNDECDQLVAYANQNEHLFGQLGNPRTNFWDGRSLSEGAASMQIKYLMRAIAKRMNLELERVSANGVLVPDLLNITRWIPGYELTPHADREEPDGSPHGMPWRDFAALMYLNDDYKGGEIYFPNQHLTIKPKKGDFVCFPGTLEFLHGVKETTSGIRYTLTSFYTYDKTKAFDPEWLNSFAIIR